MNPLAQPLSELGDEQIQREMDHLQVPLAKQQEIWDEIKLSRALRQEIFVLQAELKAGNVVSYESVSRRLSEVAEQHGHYMGIPLPDLELSHQFMTAKRTPLGKTLEYHTRQHETEYAEELASRGVRVRNSWESLGDCTVVLVEQQETGQVRTVRSGHAGTRLRKLIDTAMTRAQLPNLTAEAELRAMDSLKEKITASQWNSYVLTGIFPETSKRSDLTYFFRKGFPTLALSYHGEEQGRIIAALCLHPFGYYAGTHCGSMTPTDEVIAHLLLMRADEHGFWKKSGQWHITDTRSGV